MKIAGQIRRQVALVTVLDRNSFLVWFVPADLLAGLHKCHSRPATFDMSA